MSILTSKILSKEFCYFRRRVDAYASEGKEKSKRRLNGDTSPLRGNWLSRKTSFNSILMPLPPRQSRALDLEIAAGKLLPSIYDRPNDESILTTWRLTVNCDFPKEIRFREVGKRLWIKSTEHVAYEICKNSDVKPKNPINFEFWKK